MHTFKKVGMWLLVVFSLLVIISLMLPNAVKIERSIVINKPTPVIFEQINTLRNWTNWSPWYEKDSLVKMDYFGPESGVGAGYSWSSTNSEVGKGKLNIAYSTYDSIATNLDFMENGIATGYFTFKAVGDSTKVTWGMDADMSKPFVVGKYFGLLMESFVAADFEKGLSKLKKHVESNEMANPPIKIVLLTMAAQPIISMRVNCTLNEIGPKLGECYGKISDWIRKNDMKVTGAPLAIYHTFSETSAFDMEPAIPVNRATASSTDIKKGELPAQMVIVADYYGAYEKTGLAHEAIDQWAKNNGKNIIGAPWEQYITDPIAEPDTAKWLTKVYYPVK